jgi:large subunit ribosomal protein L35
MPKLKTHKGAKRRLHVTATGKIMHRKRNISHMRKRKAKRAKAQISNKIMADSSYQKRGHLLLPYA